MITRVFPPCSVLILFRVSFWIEDGVSGLLLNSLITNIITKHTHVTSKHLYTGGRGKHLMINASRRKRCCSSPSLPLDSSSWWIWFSRNSMATAKASRARSWNFGAIMILKLPMKSDQQIKRWEHDELHCSTWKNSQRSVITATNNPPSGRFSESLELKTSTIISFPVASLV